MDFNEIEPFWIHFGHFLDTRFKSVGRYKLDTFFGKGVFLYQKSPNHYQKLPFARWRKLVPHGFYTAR